MDDLFAHNLTSGAVFVFIVGWWSGKLIWTIAKHIWLRIKEAEHE